MAFSDYMDRLNGLPYVEVTVTLEPPGLPGFDALLELKARGRVYSLAVEEFSSQLSRRAVDHVVRARQRIAHQQGHQMLVLATHIGPTVGRALVEDAQVNYLDRSGNCHIELEDSVLIHVEGRTSPRILSTDKGLRAAAYKVLFAYLVEPQLIGAPLRKVGEVASVSRQAVDDMRRRLIEQGHVVRVKSRWQWVPRSRLESLARWAEGYRSAVRPSLLEATYRTTDRNPASLEERIIGELGRDPAKWRWGGSAAGFRLTGHFRGQRTVLHVRGAPPAATTLRAYPDPSGQLTVLRDMGEISWPESSDVVHPLLVYAEMLSEDTDRAREAAEELLAQHIMPGWETI
jgi:hypothetical protein